MYSTWLVRCLFMFILTSPLLLHAQTNESDNPKTIRAAIDIGSGATKLRVAEINPQTHKIEKILVNQSFAINYQEQLDKSPDRSFDAKIRQEGIDALKESKRIALQYKADKVVAVATESFRSASNVQNYIDEIYTKTGIPVYIIDQELEGKLAFEAVSSQSTEDPHQLIVWDIGGGSLQLTTIDQEGHFLIYRGLDASIPFKNLVISSIQRRDVKEYTTPNPMTLPQIQAAEIVARQLANKVNTQFKQKIQSPHVTVIGVGNIFSYGIFPLVGSKHIFTKDELAQATDNLAGKTDNELGGGPFANVAVTNPILVLGFMNNLNIDKMNIIDVNNADGALLYPTFWTSSRCIIQQPSV